MLSDINECEVENTGCEYCENNAGGFDCTCPSGYELSDDEKNCQDVNECEVYDDDETDNESSEKHKSSICSHECTNLVGSYQCKCPDNFHLHSDKRTCTRDFCHDLNNR